MDQLKKIVITGPESTGKSELTANLGHYFKAPFATEYARIYLEKNGPKYTFEILETIIREHLQFQQQVISTASDLIFLDTDLVNFKIWEEVVFARTHDFLENQIHTEDNHLYLICYPDLPWQADPLRENPENRMELFEKHLSLIEDLNRPYRIVKGTGKERIANAIQAVKELI